MRRHETGTTVSCVLQLWFVQLLPINDLRNLGPSAGHVWDAGTLGRTVCCLLCLSASSVNAMQLIAPVSELPLVPCIVRALFSPPFLGQKELSPTNCAVDPEQYGPKRR